MDRAKWTRREFLGAAGVGVAGFVLAACGSSSGSAKKSISRTHRFHSRPDLNPPIVDVTGPVGLPGAGDVFITVGGPLIVDDKGRPVWFRPVPHAATNFRVQQYQGKPVLTWWEGEITHYGVGQRGQAVVLDSNYREIRRVRAEKGLHADLHEFMISADGVGFLTSYHEITANLSAVGGPTKGRMLDAVVQGIDLATGAVVFEWHSAEHIDITESRAKYTDSSSGDPFDPVHLNSIDFTADGNILLSARNTWTVYKVDRASGHIIWRLGGKKNDFTRGPGVHFAWQHDARVHPNNVLTLFDDEGDPPEAKQSRGLVLNVDETAMTATLVRAYYHPNRKLLAGSQGSVQILPNNDVFVGWGAEPYYTEYRQDGTTVLDGHILKGQSYRALRFPWVGVPTDHPAVAATRRTSTHLTVYASWNGATEVESWSVLAGPRRDSLSVLGASNRIGFETPIEVQVPASTRYVSVQAIDGQGSTIGASPVIRA